MLEMVVITFEPAINLSKYLERGNERKLGLSGSCGLVTSSTARSLVFSSRKILQVARLDFSGITLLPRFSIRDFKIQRRGRKRVKKTIGLISKTTTSHVHHTFLYISFPLLHDYDVKMPNFAFYCGRK